MLRTRPSVDTVLLTALALSLCGNVVLGLRVIRAPSPVADSQVAIGTQMPDLDLVVPGSERSKIAVNDAKPLLLYTFTKTCSWCRLNKPDIESIARSTADRYRFVPICLDCGPKEEQRVAGMTAFVDPSDDTVRSYRLGFVPMTMVVSTDGRVSALWRGAFVDPALRSDVERTLSVTLTKPEGGL